MPTVLNFDDFHNLVEQAAYDVFLELNLLEEGSAAGSVDNPSSPTYKALKNKSDKSGFPLGILKQVFKRGKASWKLGHRPGVPPNQWAHARVNSFITGGKTTKMQDKKLYQRAKKNRKKKKK